MQSQKKSSLKSCSHCKSQLTQKNWMIYDKKIGHHICSSCRKNQDKKRHNRDDQYNKKQAARYHMRKSAVIFSYGNQCSICQEDDYEKLTMDCLKKRPTNLYDWLYNHSVRKNDFQVICYNCSRNKYMKHKDKYALRDKQLVIDHYGGCCATCKEDKIELLIVNQDKKIESGIAFYRWIIKNNYPSDLGFQILCVNCDRNKKAIKKLLEQELSELDRIQSMESVHI